MKYTSVWKEYQRKDNKKTNKFDNLETDILIMSVSF